MKHQKRKKHDEPLDELEGQCGKKSSDEKDKKRTYHTTLTKHSRMNRFPPSKKKIEPRETTEASRDEKRQVAAAAAEARLNENPIVDSYTAMDELD
jgi:ribosomal protein S18